MFSKLKNPKFKSKSIYVSDFAIISATGTQSTSFYNIGNISYQSITFTGAGSLIIQKPGRIEAMIIAGGGGGARGDTSKSGGGDELGGGGAGALKWGEFFISTGSYAVSIGGGGGGVNAALAAGAGGASSISGLISCGGGQGGFAHWEGVSDAGQGAAGGCKSGKRVGGGAATLPGGGVGGSGSYSGGLSDGISLNYSGGSVTYGIGGNALNVSGRTNSGDGGGYAANGGSGIVIVRVEL
jgi:hypothetical protein